MKEARILQIAIIVSTVAIAVADITMSSDLVVARLFTLPLALCVFQTSTWLLAGTTAVAAGSTIITGIVIHFRPTSGATWTDAANRGLLVGSLLVFTVFIYLVMRNVSLRLADAERIKAMSDELAARNIDLAGQVADAAAQASERERVADSIASSERQYRGLLEAAPDAMIVSDRGGHILLINAETERLFGYPRAELIGKPVDLLVPERFRGQHSGHREGYTAHPRTRTMGEGRKLWGLRKDGTEFPVEISLSPTELPEGILITTAIRDISPRMAAEEALRRSEERHRMAVEVAEMGTWLWKLETDEVSWSPEFGRLFALPADAVLTYDAITAHIHPEDKPKIDAAINAALERNIPYDIQYRIIWPDGSVRWLVARGRVHRKPDGTPIDMQGVIMDVTSRVESEKTLRLAEERHRMAVEVAEMGTWTMNLASGEISWSDEFSRLYGFAPADTPTREDIVSRIPAEERQRINEAVEAAAAGRAAFDLEYHIVWPDGSVHWLASRGRLHKDAAGSPIDLQGVIMDITERKQLQELRLHRDAERLRAEALARSNEELQQFAYIAAHDLQEPLRMVASYTQLLGQRYKGRLDDDADDFITFAVDGARRMQMLISDLLAYCRVETAGREPAEVSSREALDEAVRNLEGTVAENDAHIVCDQLPLVMADRTQLIQLFQNLVGNAIKYRTPDRPEIHISARRGAPNEWIFSVRDNGIGIDPKYSEKIFLMFQRLHSRDEFSGTGIGLTLCKKIAERHGGRIWVEPNQGPGSTFHVALPERVMQ